MMNAIRNMRPVPRYEDRTIYGDVEAKVGASVVQLSARSPGKMDMHKGSLNISNQFIRFRQPLPAPYLRARARGRHLRPFRPYSTLKKQDERRQGSFRGDDVAASARGCREGTRQEDGRREEGVLRRQGLLIELSKRM
jgi:hypothetical protein